MVVSLEAIILSVFVLLSQNRQVARDRVRNDIEYDVNLKAELEIAHLHEKFDHLHDELLQRLTNIERHSKRPPIVTARSQRWGGTGGASACRGRWLSDACLPKHASVLPSWRQAFAVGCVTSPRVESDGAIRI